jgi:hypothetical protein
MALPIEVKPVQGAVHEEVRSVLVAIDSDNAAELCADARVCANCGEGSSGFALASQASPADREGLTGFGSLSLRRVATAASELM